MNSIDAKIIDGLLEWAEENEDKYIFSQISKEKESYYVDRKSEDTYIMEYSFQTLAELKKMLEVYSGLTSDPEMLKKLTIGICQERFRGEVKMNVDGNIGADSAKVYNDKRTLPEYIYIF